MSARSGKFYAVAVGRQPGIYTNWPDAQAQVNRFSGSVYQSFPTEAAAREWLQQQLSRSSSSPSVSVAASSSSSFPSASAAATSSSSSLTEAPLTTPPPGATLMYTDGSAKDGLGGYGIVALTPTGDKYRIYGRVPPLYSDKPSTNNIAELYAIWVALSSETGNILLYSDSQYSIGALTAWIHDWKRKGWVGIANKEIIQSIEPLLTMSSIGTPRQVILRHVPAHSGYILNEEVDRLAEMGRIQPQIIITEKNGVRI